MRRIFWGFCRNWFPMSPLHYLSCRSDFGFEFAEIFVFEKWLPAITDTGSHRLPVTVIRGVADSPYRWVGELTTPRITDTRSRRLTASPIRRVGYWIELNWIELNWIELSRRVADSVYHRSPIQRVDDSAYYWVGELTTPRISDTGSRYSKKKLV